ncbi:hypothetical protein RCL_jg28366.t1 [Rhizophagus clarus]|uniref:Uncharacterized protein n=1 Tax=Rhizophagus clarus TaxID=94130 RepID=A0A8H3R2U4_9GLOM|nr:hypothetical protein RCL_jg28366.t1 [Rhizophagus clarus]
MLCVECPSLDSVGFSPIKFASLILEGPKQKNELTQLTYCPLVVHLAKNFECFNSFDIVYPFKLSVLSRPDGTPDQSSD